MRIHVDRVTKTYDFYPALDDVSVNVAENDLVALLGPSGSGKTTLLRVIAGLEHPERGRILFDDEDVTNVPVQRRGIGFVFQNYALFGHMTVADNVAFGLRVRKVPKAEARERVMELLRLVQLESMAARLPGQLSGGQRQRVALARALAPNPRVLLLDEPFGALDARVRRELREWLRRLHDEIHVTSVFVTHDQEEAFEVADHVVILHKGRVQQTGTPDEVFDSPENPFVLDFLGDVAAIPGFAEAGQGTFGSLSAPAPGATVRAPAHAWVRGHDLALAPDGDVPARLLARIADHRRIGAVVRLTLVERDTGARIATVVPHHEWVSLGLALGDFVEAGVRRVHVVTEGLE